MSQNVVEVIVSPNPDPVQVTINPTTNVVEVTITPVQNTVQVQINEPALIDQSLAIAIQKAEEASQSAQDSAQSAQESLTSSQDSANSAQQSSDSAAAALLSEQAAAASKQAAETAESNAETAAVTATTQADIATTKATEATDALNQILPIAQDIADLNLFLSTFTVELINSLTVDFYAPQALKITGSTAIIGTPTVTVLVNDSAYTLDTAIAQGAKITVNVSVASVVNLAITYL